MKRLFVLIVVFAMSASVSQAMELLSNGDLSLTTQVGPPALYYPEFTDWTMGSDPCSWSPCAIVPYTGYQVFYTPYPVYPAGFADRLGGGTGLIFSSYEGNSFFPGEIDGEIKQSVPGVAGKTYTFSGWAHFEGGYAGGVDFLDLLSGNERNVAAQLANPGVPVASLTDTFFALEFLDGVGTVLPGSVLYELYDDGGQVNDPDYQTNGRIWQQHSLTAVAPVGTVSVQVRVAMVNGEFNVDMPAQSAFVDDLSLTCVPEPGSIIMGLMGLAFLGVGRRSR